MCGVLVHVRPTLDQPPPEPARWERAMARLARRGPDGRGHWGAPSGLAHLGHSRLAINDLSPAGAQPMVLERSGRGPLALVANGEIYNAPTLRARLERAGCRFRGYSDCEVLLHATDRWGFEGALEAVRGMFALVVWDDETRTLRAAVDHAGMKPLVVSSTPRGLILASDADAVLAMLPERPALEPMAMAHTLALGYCPAPLTMWEGVRKLGPGERLEWRASAAGVGRAALEPRTVRWWAPRQEPDPGAPSDPREQQEQFGTLWRGVVAEHLLSDVPVGVFLSGGLDSSAVAAAVAESHDGLAARSAGSRPAPGGHAVRAFTLALESSDDESPAAAETARHLGLEHTVIPMGRAGLDAALAEYAASFDEPQGYGALLTAVTLARSAREHGRVMLAGDGGDEALAGYTWHTPMPPVPQEIMQPAAIGAAGGVTSGARPPRHGSGVLEAPSSAAFIAAHFRRVLPRFEPRDIQRLLEPMGCRYDEEAFVGWAAPHDRPGLGWPRRAQALDLSTFCAGSILPKIDRATMGVGLEVRAPFLDRRVLEWALALPVSAADASAASPSKAVLRRYLAGRVPASILSRPKQGFSLRLGAGVWEAHAAGLGDTRLIRDGLLHEHWREIVAPDRPHASGRMQALCMLAAWWEGRA